MVEANVLPLFIDTSYLRKTGFHHPDFQLLLRYSKEGQIKIFVSHIAWEERRTQLTEDLYSKVRSLRRLVEDLQTPRLGRIAIQGLDPVAVTAWSDSEIDAQSRETMEGFAAQNKIEIVAIGDDHGERSWSRYFKVEPPFNPNKDRENRRKDIPDCWILECAIDLLNEYPALYALCNDDNLTGALESKGITVFREAQRIVDIIDAALAPTLVSKDAEVTAVAKPLQGDREDRLDSVLATTRERFREIDTKVLGYVGYFGTPSKDQLFSLLSRAGVPPDHARNAAERLTIEGLIRDTGNHYLPENKEACDLAASRIEPEIIKLLDT
jgi:hypothetical protein